MAPRGLKRAAADKVGSAPRGADGSDSDEALAQPPPPKELPKRPRTTAASSSSLACLRCRSSNSVATWASYNSVRTASGTSQAPIGPACATCEAFRLKYFPYVSFETMCESPNEVAEAEQSEQGMAKNFKEEEISTCVRHQLEIVRPFIVLTEKGLKTLGEVSRLAKTATDNLSFVVVPSINEAGEFINEKFFLFSKSDDDPPWATMLNIKSSVQADARTIFMQPELRGWHRQGVFSMQQARADMIDNTEGFGDFLNRDPKNITTLNAWLKAKFKKTLPTPATGSALISSTASPIASSSSCVADPTGAQGIGAALASAASVRSSGPLSSPPKVCMTPTPRKRPGSGVAELVQLHNLSSSARSCASSKGKRGLARSTAGRSRRNLAADDDGSGHESAKSEGTCMSDDGELSAAPEMAGDISGPTPTP